MLSSTSSLSSRIGFLTGLSLSCLHSKIIFSLFFSMVRKDFPRLFQWQDKIFLVFSPKIESFCRTGHWNWALAAFAIITLPGLAIIIGLVSQSVSQSDFTHSILYRDLTTQAQAVANTSGGFSLSLPIPPSFSRRMKLKSIFL